MNNENCFAVRNVSLHITPKKPFVYESDSDGGLLQG